MMDAESRPRRNVPSSIRVSVMLGAGVIVGLAVGFLGSWLYAAVVGWAASCLVYIVWVWVTVWRMSPDQTKQHASREDPSRATSGALLLIASVASLAALLFVLTQATSSSPDQKAILASIGVASVVLSWLLVHTIYTLRYAVLYYADRSKPVNFNQTQAPRYTDFAYVSFTVGMTFQVSDTNLQSSPIRAAALKHALLSYLFGAVILAGAVNVVAGLIG
ncbi:MAG TPA: DUF1345 domain-containing protein [Galbitalea sp.]|nr:DUF1345 domain-containing protein [Galbitalea sp.]